MSQNEQIIDFKREVETNFSIDFPTVKNWERWAKSIAQRVEESTIQRCIKYYELELDGSKESYIPRLYATPEGAKK